MAAAAGIAAVVGVLVLLVAGGSGARLPARGAADRGQALPRGGAPATAVFALGSFWRSEAAFGCLPGVIRTSVGYAGGSKANPEYRNLADHAECVKVQNPPIIIVAYLALYYFAYASKWFIQFMCCERVIKEIDACFVLRVEC